MKAYVKPVVNVDAGLGEGVYAASGCYTATWNIHQSPQNGRGDYRIQINGVHKADHSNNAQTVTVSFNQEVVYKYSNGTLVSGNKGTTLVVNFAYHQNPEENLGLGDFVVESEPGLSVISVKITD